VQHPTVPGLWLERGVIDAADERLPQSPLGLAGQRCMASMFFAAGTALERNRCDAALDAAQADMDAHPTLTAPCLLDPRLQGVPGSLGDFELRWALRCVLHDDGARRQLIAMTGITDLGGDEVAAAKLAVHAQVEEGQRTNTVFHLKANPERPDILELERCLLADDLAFAPWLAMSR